MTNKTPRLRYGNVYNQWLKLNTDYKQGVIILKVPLRDYQTFATNKRTHAVPNGYMLNYTIIQGEYIHTKYDRVMRVGFDDILYIPKRLGNMMDHALNPNHHAIRKNGLKYTYHSIIKNKLVSQDCFCWNEFYDDRMDYLKTLLKDTRYSSNEKRALEKVFDWILTIAHKKYSNTIF